MDNNIAIKVKQVSKKYCRSLRRSMWYGLKDITKNALGLGSHPEKLRRNEFWALDDISFEVAKGETLGIIGPNGSGKTTLLKLLNGIFWPDKGKISIRGKVGALIEVGAGFHPSLTGRQNIYINAAILGMTKKEIEEKLDDIIKFADIGNYINSPVKFYSSGMYVRLGFAVAVHCEPDILLVDEVLAVGDRNFQIKCFRKMHELKKRQDTSIVIVSHNEYVMREYCKDCIVLNKGKKLFYGESEEAISFYINNIVIENKEIDLKQGTIFNREIVKKVSFIDGSGNDVERIPTGEKLIIDFHFETKETIKSPIFGISFYDYQGLFTGFWNSYENVKFPDIINKGKIRVTINNFDLPVGSYRYAVVVCEKEESNALQWRDFEKKLIVERPQNTRGLLKLKQSWEILT